MFKSDRWIRKNAQEHHMINPFSEKADTRGRHLLGIVFVWL